MIIGTIIAIMALICMSAFFSGSETALTAASRARIHTLDREGDARARLVNRLISDRERLIGAILLGNNLVNILASAIATSLFISLFGQSGVAIATAVMTALVLIFAEVLPKTYAITRADSMAMSVARPISWLVGAASWVVFSIQAVVNITLRLIGVQPPTDAVTPEEDIRGTIDLHHSEEGLDAKDRHRLVGALDLKDMKVEGYDMVKQIDSMNKEFQTIYQVLNTLTHLLGIKPVDTEHGQRLDIDSLVNKVQELAQKDSKPEETKETE